MVRFLWMQCNVSSRDSTGTTFSHAKWGKERREGKSWAGAERSGILSLCFAMLCCVVG